MGKVTGRPAAGAAAAGAKAGDQVSLLDLLKPVSAEEVDEAKRRARRAEAREIVEQTLNMLHMTRPVEHMGAFYEALDDHTRLMIDWGWFEQTLPALERVQQLALLQLDEALETLAGEKPRPQIEQPPLLRLLRDRFKALVERAVTPIERSAGQEPRPQSTE